MGKTTKKIELSQKHKAETEATEKALQKVSEKLIAETKAKNSYLVVSDEAGNIKKIPPKTFDSQSLLLLAGSFCEGIKPAAFTFYPVSSPSILF